MAAWPELVFGLRLASHLRRPLGELLGFSEPGAPLAAVEFALWLDYYRDNGFDVDRLEWAGVNAGAAACRAWGVDVKPSDLIPQFQTMPIERQRQSLISLLDRLPGV